MDRVRPAPARPRAAVIRPNGRGDRRVTNLPASTAFLGTDTSFAWAPRGGRIAFVSYLAANDREIYSMRPDGSGVLRLTGDVVDDEQPRLAPDGSRIAFVRRGRSRIGDLYVMRVDGRQKRRIASGSSPSWSPDGRELAFTGEDASRPVGIADATVVAVTPATGGPVRQLARGSLPAWSPNSGQIAYLSPEGDAVHSVAPDGSGVRTLVDAAELRAAIPGLAAPTAHLRFLERPTWSPDGRELLFFLVWDGVRPPTRRTAMLVDADGSNVRPAWFGTAPAAAWSPDGSRLLLDLGSSFAVGPADAFRTVTGDWIENDDPDWGPRR